ncbi:zinc transporter ZIP6 isoform X3 [Petaurus breviceps papuanus]|uniref:zinc transporter ZIP6 isoform X3 n=1 Tax=Petaurus breviceps papuanus TaxID=3040969 RepID=UPI0036DC9892
MPQSQARGQLGAGLGAGRTLQEITMEKIFLVALLFTLIISVLGNHHGMEPEKSVPNWATSINVDLAIVTQRQHLQELFHRYGENNSLTVEGFRKLLQNIGLDKTKRIHINHDHDHHHHHHGTTNKNIKKTLCPDHESGGTIKDTRNSQIKGLHKSENIESQPSILVKDSVSEMTTAIYSTAIGGNHFLKTTKHLLPKDLNISSAPSTTEGNGVSLPPREKANESVVNEADRGGSSIYSKHSNQNVQECFNASKLLQSHGMGIQVLLNATEFNYLCPAIINQIDGKSCIVHVTSEKKTEITPKTYSLQIAWIGGFIAISIISFLSLLGVILVPLMNRVFFKFLLSFLVALAVGTLSGDAFLHLLPHSHASHHHSHSHEDQPLQASRGPLFSHLSSQNIEESTYFDSTWKGLTALGGLYFMFLAEHLITLIKQFKDKKKKTQKKPESDDEMEIKKQLSKYESQLSTNEEKLDTDDRQSDDLIHHHHDYHHILHHHHHQNHHPHSHSQRYSREELKDAGIATLAWMVIMGDGLHNFSDGLAIGAAFTEGLSSGLSTSVAVFCHELPHELGDFAVLLKAGMTVKQAVLYNALSAMLAYLGMATGIFIGHYAENVSMWIFALTAGLFMYVALVDMVPEMLHNDASDHGCSRWGYFLLQNAGILLGFGIMLLISVFEHKIVFSINF